MSEEVDAFFVFLLLIGMLAVGFLAGAVMTEPHNIKSGRDQGIIFCTEKPQECKIEYSYLKLKEAQK